MAFNEDVLGTLLVGIFFNTYLYGLVTYQFASYRASKFNDPVWIKIFVGALFVVDTFHTAAVMYMAWEYCVANYVNPAILKDALWPYTFTPIGTAIAAILTQIFLGYRIYRLTNHLWMFIGILVVSVVSFCLGIACGTRAWMIRELSKLSVLDDLVTAWLAMQMGLDIFITVTLVWVLSRAKTRFRATDTVINRLIRGAVQTGVFACVFSAGDLIAFLVAPHTNLYGMFAIPIGRIYTNTLMDTLLMREGIRNILSKSNEDSLDPSSSIWGRSTGNSQGQNFSRISFNRSHLQTGATGHLDTTNPPLDTERENDGDSNLKGPTEGDSQDRHGDIKVIPAEV